MCKCVDNLITSNLAMLQVTKLFQLNLDKFFFFFLAAHVDCGIVKTIVVQK
jgi:hypothetical protein